MDCFERLQDEMVLCSQGLEGGCDACPPDVNKECHEWWNSLPEQISESECRGYIIKIMSFKSKSRRLLSGVKD